MASNTTNTAIARVIAAAEPPGKSSSHIDKGNDKAGARDKDKGGSATVADKDKDKKDEPLYVPSEMRIRIEFDRDIPQGTVLLQGARVITMNGKEIFESGDILVRNNRIQAVGRNGSLKHHGSVLCPQHATDQLCSGSRGVRAGF